MTLDKTLPDTISDIQIKTVQGAEVPSLGFGTWELKGTECQASVEKALEVGYRHVDTARVYENEKSVGQALQSSAVPRRQLFVTSKVWMEDLSPATVMAEVGKSLDLLQTDYLDLVLIHWPNPQQALEPAIQALAKLKQNGCIKQLGVSNFPTRLMKEAMAYGEVFCNQVEYHPLLSQDAVLDVARAHDILVTAYCPLAQGVALQHPTLKEIGDKYDKAASQVALRWLIEQDRVVAIPRSSKPDHISSNFDIFDFALDADDLQKIAAMPKDHRQCNPDWALTWD